MIKSNYINGTVCTKCGKEFKESQKDIRDNYGKYFTNKHIKDIVDRRLHEMAALESTLGSDSTEEEKELVKKRQVILMDEIKEIDEITFKRLSYE
tara:strand:- start:72 stop:356 length:285 start_codon:yes stop_codon:yes gene_type:complete